MDFRRHRRLKMRTLLDLTPLIDVVLLLVFFFMLSATFTVTTAIPVEAAQADGPRHFEERDIVVTLSTEAGGPDSQGKIFINDVAIDTWEEVGETLRSIYQAKPDALVLIRPDARVPAAQLIRLLSVANAAGINHYAIAAQAPREAP